MAEAISNENSKFISFILKLVVHIAYYEYCVMNVFYDSAWRQIQYQ